MSIAANLPFEVLELIVNLLLRSLPEDEEPKKAIKLVIGQLRLVCKSWSSILLHRLYQSLCIEDDEHSNKILSHWRSSNHLAAAYEIPRTQKLSIKQLWVGSPSCVRRDESFSGFCNLDQLSLLFAESLIELDLEFIDCFDFPSTTVRSLGKLKYLSSLRISIIAERIIPPDQHQPIWIGSRGSYRPDSLLPVLLASRSLQSLDFCRLPALPVPRGPLPACLPLIRHLEFDYMGDQSSEALVNLCLALKPSLRILSVRGFRQDTHQLKPVFETLRDNLEGLFISNETLLADVLDLSFPCLKVLRINYWAECIGRFLDRPMFENVTTIALYSHTIYRRRRQFRTDPFRHIPNLKQMIFTHTRVGDEAPYNYSEACQRRGIRLIHINHGSVQEIMKLDAMLPNPT